MYATLQYIWKLTWINTRFKNTTPNENGEMSLFVMHIINNPFFFTLKPKHDFVHEMHIVVGEKIPAI